MNKFYILFIFLLGSVLVFGQAKSVALNQPLNYQPVYVTPTNYGVTAIKWEETFNTTTLPTDWTVVDNDGSGTFWEFRQIVTFTSGDTVNPQAGQSFWFSNFNNANTNGLIDEWLISPQLPMVENGDSLYFWAGAIDAGFDDSLKVMVSTTDTSLASFTQIGYFKVDGPVGSWHQYGFDMSAFAGSQVYVAVNYYIVDGGPSGNYSDNVWVDHFTLTGAGGVPALPFVENFDYPVGDSLINHGWVNHSGTGTQIVVQSGSLTYTGYPNSGIGNSVTVAGGSGSREDVHAEFAPVSSGSLYTAFLVNISTATTTGDYFFHLAPAFPTTFFKPRLLVRDDGAGNLQFGLTKATVASAVYTTTPYSYNTTYLLVLKYEMPAGDSNDVASLYINPPLDMEPGSADLVTTDLVADDAIGAVCLRQGSQGYTVQVDGIGIGTIWNQILPVEITTFTANTKNGNVVLNWSTATELNNSGFEVQRKINSDYKTIGFVAGNGTTTDVQNYSYTDNNVNSGNYSYRLKQIDFNGTFAYSEEVNVDVTSPVKFGLGQNYPNPFNPSTKINFSIPQNSEVTLTVFNVLGQEVKTLVQGFMVAGNHTIDFNAAGFNSGIYFYKLQAGSFSEVRKMTLLK